jgi:PGAP1-like protein
MLTATLGFLIRNQWLPVLLLGAAISAVLYYFAGRYILRALRALRQIKKFYLDFDLNTIAPPLVSIFNNIGPLLGYHQSVAHHIEEFSSTLQIRIPVRYLKTSLTIILSFLLGLIFLPVLGSVIAAIYDEEIVNKTALLDPPEPIRMQPNSRIALVLLHGWTGESKSTWGPFSKILKDDPRLKDIDIWAADYPTYLSLTHLPLSRISGWIFDNFFVTTLFSKYEKIYIIAHSLGGVIAREIYVLSVLRQGHSSIKMIISIGSPFSGAPRAKLGEAIGIKPDYLKEITPSSSYLATLSQNWQIVRDKVVSFCIWSPVDGIVGENSARNDCSCNTPYPQWGHTELEKPIGDGDLRYRTPIGELLGNIYRVSSRICR